MNTHTTGSLISWVVDTSATDHIVCDCSLFSDFRIVNKSFVSLPNGQQVPVNGVRNVQINPLLILQDVLFVPDFIFNFLSVSKLITNRKICLIFMNNYCIIQDLSTQKMIGKANQKMACSLRNTQQYFPHHTVH